MALTVTNKKSVQIQKSVFTEVLRDYLRVNHVSVPEDVDVSFLVDKAAFPTTPENDPVIQVSWTEEDDA